jgi:hypothetical protein
MRRALGWFSLMLLFAPLLRADTIWQTTAQGKQIIIQRDAIVVGEDSSFVVYKHFDLRERRVTIVSLNKGSLPYFVQKGSPQEEKEIVETWKRFGYTATVTDLAGKTARVFDGYVDFYPPGGRGSLLESVPARTNLPVLLDSGGVDELDFSTIDRVEIQGGRLKITLRSGEVKTGKFLMPTEQPAEVRFLGISDNYNPASKEVFDFSIPLVRLKEIRFE